MGEAFASGGMASVHLGRLDGPLGFARTVAIKKMSAGLARSPELSAMFLDEARLAARVRHPNVVATLDAVLEDELFLVLELIQGPSLETLLTRAKGPLPPPIAVAIALGTLLGLHAAHEASDDGGASLGLVHRDVSPPNVIVGGDGIPRVADFGIAKAAHRLQRTTEVGHTKGKLRYLAPEQLRDEPVTRATDVHAASAVLWECLTGEALFGARTYGETLSLVMRHRPQSPNQLVPGLDAGLCAVVMSGLAARPDDRPPSARAMAIALEAAYPGASQSAVASFVQQVAADELERLADLVRAFEKACASSPG